MNMQDHMLNALRELYERWDALLTGLSETQINSQQMPNHWSIKDVLAHVHSWEERTVARLEAAQLNHEPVYPRWSPEQDLSTEENTDQINAWIYEFHRDHPWTKVYQAWAQDCQRLLDIAGSFSERDLLDSSRYPWLDGHSLADVLLGSYDHHQEHYEKLTAWLREQARS